MQSEFEITKHGDLSSLGLKAVNSGLSAWVGVEASGEVWTTNNPHTGGKLGQIKQASLADLEIAMKKAEEAKEKIAMVPMPKRGEAVRKIGEELRKHKAELAKLISLEMGKIISEAEGEVQEFIDMCDFACGLSRSIGGHVIPSERKEHVILEQWNPVGIVGVISAFNFPLAVFGWNFCLSLVCGNVTVWKGASSTGLITAATGAFVDKVLAECDLEGALVWMVAPGRGVGQKILEDPRISLISFTGSTPVGRTVSETVSRRFGRTILELGGNNAIHVFEDADVEMALKACVFGAVGTAGQRCTSLRRLYIHESLYDSFKERLIQAYKSLKIGDPLDRSVNVGPVHTAGAIKEFTEGLANIQRLGGKIVHGGKKLETSGFHVEPTIVEISPDAECVKDELFVPVLYLFKFSTFEQAVKLNNAVPQGLSSAIFTKNMQHVFRWMGPKGSDCGLVNVHVGTSGAEIGGAFGGEKETGNGRESGSDSWKQYMRRSTCTVNFGNELPLAQGINFGPKL